MDLLTELIISLIVYSIICGGLTGHVAESKGKDYFAWAACGFFFGILGLIAAAGLPKEESDKPVSVFTKTCPDCAEDIPIKAIVCSHCGRRLSEADALLKLIEILKSGSTVDRIAALKMIGEGHCDTVLPYLLDIIREMKPNLRDESQKDSNVKTLFNEALQMALHSQSPTLAHDLISIARESKNDYKIQELVSGIGSLGKVSTIPDLLWFVTKPGGPDQAVAAVKGFGINALPDIEKAISEANTLDKHWYKKLMKQILAETKQ